MKDATKNDIVSNTKKMKWDPPQLTILRATDAKSGDILGTPEGASTGAEGHHYLSL